MPAVDLNRIYMLRARERRPILNGVNVPDAAGAYQRATMPGLRAQMGIAERGAAIRQREIADHADATQGIIRAVGGAIDAADRVYRRMEAANAKREAELERAQARQSASTRMEVENRYRQYMLDHAQEIYATPYGRETDGAGNLKITGPFSKALEVHNGFWDNDTKAAELRETLGEDDRARLEQEYTNWGFALQSDSAKKQSELNQQYMLKNWKDRGNTLKGEISNSLERGDVDAWKRSMMEYVEFAGEGAEIELGIRDLGGGLKRQATEQEAATISDVKRATAETLAMERIEFLHRAYIMDGDADTLAEIQAWGGEQALSDPGRLRARELAADAEEKRAQKIQQDDAEKAAAAGVQFNKSLEDANKAISGGGVDGAKVAKAALDAGYDTATAMAAGITDAGRRQAFMAKVEDSHQKAVIHYADELRAQVAFGNLSQTDYEAARAQTENLLEDMGEVVRGPLLEKMDRAIATQEANAFIEEYMKTQPDPYFGGTVTPEQKLEEARMLEMLRNKPNGMTKTIICNQLFGATGGGTRGGTGTGRVKDFTQADVSGLLAQGVPPIDVLDMMNQARGAGGMKGDAYMKGLDLCKARMTFNDAVGNQARDYVASIYGAVNEAFGTTLGNYIRVGNDGIPLVDANGKPILNGDGDKKYTTHLLKKGSLIGKSDVVMASYVGAADMHDRLTIIGDTLREAFAYGMQYVVSRKNGLVKRGETMTPAAVRQEMAELFREALVTSDAGMALSNELLEENMDTARILMAQYGIPRGRVELAREEAIQSHLWHGAVQPEENEEE